ncbi:MAG: class I SAM-dependent methyltransferase [Lachnospiraceae bacterium]|nr:class I SAM-dependent methyltransferase [Lachnospiraceae bacterium]
MKKNDAVIHTICDHAKITEGLSVLDVACGTGVMIPYYLKRHVASVIAIDISPRMAEIAREKFPEKEVTVLCGDVEVADFGRTFDRIVVYNACPHFPDPGQLVSLLSSLLAPGGILTIAHGFSRETINGRHKGGASPISRGLLPAEELAQIFSKYLEVTTVIDDETMYQVVGRCAD